MTAPAPWLSHYDPGVPTTLAPYPNRTLVDAIAEFARTDPDRTAVLFKACREKKDGDRVAVAPGDHDFAHLLLVNRGRRPAAAAPSARDPAVLLMSGGTTGTPKGVIGTHGAYVIAGAQVQAWNAAVLQ